MLKTDFCLHEVIVIMISSFLDKRYYPELVKLIPDKQ
jgi:hypothetical protein